MVTLNRFRVNDRFTLTVILAGICVSFTLLNGRDTNWDQLNYHLYVAHAFVSDRLGRDFMAASLQSYLNPIAYLPFYWMISVGVPSMAIGIALALIHALNLILLYEISRLVFRSLDGQRHLMAILATIVGAATPIFWSEMGTSFIDISTSVPVLLGILLLLRWRTQPDRKARWLFLGGVALGAAAGLKLTNAIYLVSAGILIVEIARMADVGRNWIWYGAGGVSGVLATHGYWSFLVYREFGNPVFPLLNGVFRSPDFPPMNFSVDRFVPSTTTDALFLPFRMADFKSWIYSETFAPDLRVAVALILGILFGGYLLFRRWTRPSGVRREGREEVSREADLTVPLITFVFVSVVLWILTSSNGRYGIPWLLMVGPTTVLILSRLLSRPRVYLVTGILAALQTVQSAEAGNPHWSPDAWTKSWFDVSVPERLRDTPLLHLTPSVQPYAFVTMWLHPQSAQVNIAGQYPLTPEGPGGYRVTRLLDAYEGRTRALFPIDFEPTERDRLNKLAASLDPFFSPLALKIDASDCEIVRTNVRFLTLVFDPVDNESPGNRLLRLASCNLTRIDPESPALSLERQRVAQVFNMIESQCPELFHTTGYGVEGRERLWTRHYLGSERYLVAVNGRIFLRYIRAPTERFLGTVDEWQAGLTTPACQSAS